jgi:hypothetical protein
MTVHSFQKSLEESHKNDTAPFWEAIYRKAFGEDFLGFHSVLQDGPSQRAGIDRIVVLRSTKVLTFDEKVRSSSYPDILLEIWSDYQRRTPGWAHSTKRLLCDYIAYAVLPSRTCHLLPYQLLRSILAENVQDWASLADRQQQGFCWVNADNGTYVTRSLCVPTNVLLDCFRQSMTVTWEET